MCPVCVLEFGLSGFAEAERETDLPAASRGAQRFGDYELLEEIAAGGMGVVYRARQPSLNRIVALKMIRAGQLAREADIKRFRTEAEAAANREHPQTPKVAARCVKTLAETIQFAHEQGVLHRDLKPSNIMLAADGTPRVMDFGLAKVAAADSQLTLSGTVMGSPGYMPPEQAAGRLSEVDERSDVYSLGAILYELMTGAPPFRAASPVETLKLVVDQEPVAPRTLNPKLPRDLETICLKCLAKPPARRYATAQELAEDLARYLDDEPIRARPVGSAEKLGLWCRRKPALAAAAGISFLLLTALALVSTSAAIRLQREGEKTLRAKQDAEEKLRASQLAQATAERLSGTAGRRARGLAAITAAARTRPSLELRNEAVACLALNDLGETLYWREYSNELTTGHALAWDAGLERYALGYGTGRVKVERIRDSQVVADFDLFRSRPRFAVFSRDGRYLAATAADGTVRVRALDPRASLVEQAYPAVPVLGNTVAFHPDNRWLAVMGRDQRLHFYDLVNGNSMPSLPLAVAPDCVEFSPRGDCLAAAVGREIHCWSWPKLELLRIFKNSMKVTCLAWNPDGRRLAAGDALGNIVGWDPVLDLSLTLPAHSQYVSVIAFNPHGDVVGSHGWDGFSRFWDAASARQLFTTAQGLISQFSQDGLRVATHREAVGFGVRQFVRSASFRTVPTHLEATGADISPDGRWLAYAETTGWHLWDLATSREITNVPLPRVRSPVFHPDGSGLLVVAPDELIYWPLRIVASGLVEVGASRTVLTARGRDLARVALTPDGRQCAVAGRYSSYVFDWRDPEKVAEFSRDILQSHVTVSPGGEWIVTTTHNGVGVSLWTAEGRFERRLITNDNCRAAFSTDGQSLVTASSRDYSFWDTRTWQVRRQVKLNLGSAVGGPIEFSPDGRMLAVAANRRDIKLLHPQTGEEFATLTAPDSQNLSRLAFSADGGWLAGTGSRVIQIWNLRALRGELETIGLAW
jgi:WD40 repeat protein